MNAAPMRGWRETDEAAGSMPAKAPEGDRKGFGPERFGRKLTRSRTWSYDWIDPHLGGTMGWPQGQPIAYFGPLDFRKFEPARRARTKRRTALTFAAGGKGSLRDA
jgi:hypothetical protein